MPEYETHVGTAPNVDEQHEARTIMRTDVDGTVYMMTEIGDGTFVQWSDCHQCHKRIGDCGCAGGPVEPPYIERWRTHRFIDSFAGRGVEPALPVLLKTRNRRIDAVIRLLRSQGWTITNPRGDTLTSGEFRVDGLEAPDIIDPDDVEGASDDPDYGGHVESMAGESEDERDHRETLPGEEAYDESFAAKMDEQEEGVAQQVHAGLDAAIERVREQKGGEDVGF